MGLYVQLEQIARTIANVQVGDTGYAFLVDKAGHILAMPPQAYSMYRLSPEEISLKFRPRIIGPRKGTLRSSGSNRKDDQR